MQNLKEFLKEKSYTSIRRYPHICNQIDLEIKKLGKDKTKHLKEKIYILKNNIQDEPVCKTCGNSVEYSLRKERYLNYCSPECSNACPEVRKKKIETCLKNYGVENPLKSEKIKEKTKQTCLQKYGVENPLMLLKNELNKSYEEKYGKERSQKILEKRKQTCVQKYGVEYGTQSEQAKKKRCNTNLQRYGGNAPACDDQIKQKIQQTNVQKYGTISPLQNKQIQEKNKLPYEQRYGKNCEKVKQNRKKAFLEKFGVENPFANQEIKQKIKQTLLEKYGVENIAQTDYVKNIHKKRYYDKLFSLNQIKPNFSMQEYGGEKYKIYSWECSKTGKKFDAWYANGLIPMCPCCHPKEGTNIENFIISFLKKHQIEYQFRNRSILGDGSELDFYIPVKNMAIEVHGLYWHTERKIMERGKNPRLYHLGKLESSEKNNIRLIQIFSDEILNHPRIVESRLKTIMGIKKRTVGARECEVRKVDGTVKSRFLNKYHLQGDDRSSICLGLFRKNRLVSIMTFAKPRLVMGHKNPPQGSYELLRFCSNFHFSVAGGAGKLLNHFLKNYTWTKIITYADRRWSVGNLYKKLGFIFTHNSSPNYFYTKNYMFREYRYKYNKSILVKRYPELKDYSERIIMDSLGYERIHDCGHASFCLINNTNV